MIILMYVKRLEHVVSDTSMCFRELQYTLPASAEDMKACQENKNDVSKQKTQGLFGVKVYDNINSTENQILLNYLCVLILCMLFERKCLCIF